LEAIERMRRHFPKPAVAMGEAWFMSDERKMYRELMTTPLSELPIEDLHHVLFEIAQGKNFDPETEAEEWNPWFRHMLPELILRSHERYVSYLLESIVTTLIVIFGQHLDAEYPGFQRDAVNTVGVALMNPGFWPIPEGAADSPENGVPRFLLTEHRGKLDIELVGFGQAPNVLSAAMCFCLKYLTPDDIPSWVDSIFAIEHLHWRLGFFVWLLGARRFLVERTGNAIEDTIPEIDWNDWFFLETKTEQPLIARENAVAFVNRVLTHLTHDAIDAWTEQFRADARIGQLAGLNWLMSRIHDLTYPDSLRA
jgi:hypothetical protein